MCSGAHGAQSATVGKVWRSGQYRTVTWLPHDLREREANGYPYAMLSKNRPDVHVCADVLAAVGLRRCHARPERPGEKPQRRMVHPSKATCSRGGLMDVRHNAENTETVIPIAGTSG